MKNLLIVLFALLAFSCSSSKDDSDPDAPTTFVFYQEVENVLPESFVAYYAPDGTCIKLADIGDIQPKKFTKEITVTIDTLNYIYLFMEYYTSEEKGRRFKDSFKLERNRKNVFNLKENMGGLSVDRSDPKQFPQD